MIRLKRFAEDQNGAASVVEATLIYPIVIMTVVLMIYIGVYMLETSLLKDMAGKTAVMSGRTISFPGYNELGDIYSGQPDFAWSDDGPSIGQINNAYNKSVPYRYIILGDADSRFRNAAEKFASELVFSSDSPECTIDVKRHVLSRRIIVNIKKKVSMPQIFKYLRINDNYNINVSASAITYDPAEFIRNTDITVNFAGYLAEKFNFSDKLSSVCKKLSGFIEMFNVHGNSE